MGQQSFAELTPMNIQIISTKQIQSQLNTDMQRGNSELFSLGKRSAESLNTQESFPELVAKKQIKRSKSIARRTPLKSTSKTNSQSRYSFFSNLDRDLKSDITALPTCPTKHTDTKTVSALNKTLNSKLSISLLEFEESLQRLKIAAQKSLSEDSHPQSDNSP